MDVLKVFLVAMPLHATAVVCNGTSTVLPQAQCEAWVEFFDATNGAGWVGFKYNPQVPIYYSTYRTDPCSMVGSGAMVPKGGTTPLNFCDEGGTTIQKM